MKVLIRKVPSRNVDDIIESLHTSGFTDDEIVVFEDTEYKGCIWSMFEAFKLMDEDCIYLQDDVILTSNFKEKMNGLIKKTKGKFVINLFKMREADDKIGYQPPFYSWWSFQGLFIPSKIKDEFLSWFLSLKESDYPRWVKVRFEQKYDDGLFLDWLIKIHKPAYVYNQGPNWVQHKELQSAVEPRRPRKRISSMFEE